MATRTFTATVSSDVAERIEDYARFTEQSASNVVELAIDRWVAWEKEKARLSLEAAERAELVGTVDDAEVAAWIESLDTETPSPLPKARK